MREKLERALGRYLVPEGNQISRAYLLNALAEQATVIEVEVEHHGDACGAWTSVFGECLDEHLGTPGKALAIIVPLEEVDGE